MPAGFVALDSAETGVALVYPANWTLEESAGFGVVVTSRPGMLDESTMTNGAAVFIFADPTLGLLPPDQAIESVAGGILEGDDFTDLTVEQEMELLTINGQDAARIVYSGVTGDDEAVVITFMVIQGDGNAAVAFAVTSSDQADENEPLLATTLNSIVLSEPVVAGSPTPPAGGDTPPPTQGVIAMEPGNVYRGGVADNGSATFTFEAQANQDFAFVVLPGPDFDHTLTLYDADDNELEYVDDGFSGEAEYFLIQPEADALYRLDVAGWSGAPGGFWAAVAVADEDAPGTLLIDDDTIPANDGVDYTLTVAEGEAFIVVFTPLDDDLDGTLTFTDAAGNEVNRVDDGFSGEPEATLLVAEPGEYTLTVAAFGGDSGAYRLAIASGVIINAGAGGAGALPNSSDQPFDTVFPLPEDAGNFIGSGGDTLLIYNTGLTLEEIATFYRDTLLPLGYVERGLVTIVNDTVVNLVLDGDESGRALVIQAVPLDATTRVVTVRFEDV